MDSVLKKFTSNSIFPISIYDRDMRLLAVSEPWKRMYQIADDQIGKIHYDTFSELPAHWIAAHKTALDGKLSEHIEEPYLLSNGAMGWHRWQCSPWHSADGVIQGIIITAEDVTARKERDIELNKVLARFELIQQAAKIGMWDWDIINRNITFNAEYYDVLGWDKNTNISNEEFYSLIHPDDLHRVKTSLNVALEGDSKYEAEFRIYRHDDGKLRWVKDKGYIEFNENNVPVRGYGAIIDFTEQKLRSDQELIAVGGNYEKFMDTMPVGVSVVDRIGVIIYANDALLNMLGYSEEEMVGRSLFNFIDASLRDQASINLNDRINGVSGDHEFCVKHKNGSDVWLSISGHPYIENGEIIGNISVHMNFTNRKKYELGLEMRIEELENILTSKSV